MSKYEIRRDGAVRKDAITIFKVDVTALPTDVWAVTYDDVLERGEVQFTANYDDDPLILPVPNRQINKTEWDAEFAIFLNKREEAKTALQNKHDTEINKLSEEDYRRLDPEYPSIFEIVDALFEKESTGSTTKINALKTRKTTIENRYKRKTTDERKNELKIQGRNLDWIDPDAT